MNIDQFISTISRGLVRGFRSLIDDKLFLESEGMTRQEAEHLCRMHVIQIVESQDGYPEELLRPERTLTDRQHQFRSNK